MTAEQSLLTPILTRAGESTVSPQIETIAGVERKLYYTPEQSERIVTGHQRIAEERGLTRPYFLYTDKGDPFFYQVDLGESTTLSVGPTGTFTALQLASGIQEQTVNYVILDTMGRQFPRNNPRAVEDLTAIMIDDFSENDIIVLFERRTRDGVNPLAGVRAHYGRNDVPLHDLIFKRNDSIVQPSTLATFQSLRMPADLVVQHIPFLQQFGQLSENQLVCMSRLYRQDPRTSESLGLKDRDIAWKAMAALVVGFVDYAWKHPEKVNLPELAVYDTHNGYIQRKLREYFRMQQLGEPGEAVPTDEVLQTILYHHYGPNEDGGYREDILIGYVSVPAYLIRALNFLKDRGIEPSSPSLDDYIRNTIVRKSVVIPEFPVVGPQEAVSAEALAPFIHLVEPYPREIPHPDELAPVILDHHTPEGQRQLHKIASSITDPETNISTAPFDGAVRELLQLAKISADIPTTKAEIVDKIASAILEKTSGIEVQDIKSLLEANPIGKDLAHQSHQLSVHASSPEVLEAESLWLYNPASGKLTKFVGPDAHRILLRSRLLGLIPFDSIEKGVRKEKFRVAGASAVAMALDLLASIGAEDIEFWDAGFIDDSNISRFPAGMGHYENIGGSKALALQSVLYGRNPYGRFRGFHGRVVSTESEKTEPYDVTYEQLTEDGGFTFEVIDNPWGKTRFRLFMEKKWPDLPIGFLADTGNRGMFGIEIPGRGKPFNQELPREEKERMATVPAEILAIDDEGERTRALRKEALRSVLLMLDDDLPPEHQLQFVFSLLEGLPWSQTPIAAHDSAAIANKAIICYYSRDDSSVKAPMDGRNFHPDDAPKSLVPHLDDRQAHTLQEVLRQLFDLNLSVD